MCFISKTKLLTAILSILIIFACSDHNSTTNNSQLANSEQTLTDSNKIKRSDQAHTPPKADKKSHILKIHGHSRNDEYFWLRDDSRKSKQVLAYLEAENLFTKTKLAHTEELQQKLYDEMTGRLEPNEESVPSFENGYWYWSKFEQGKDYRISMRRKGDANSTHENVSEEILVDQNKRADGHDYYRLAALEISRDNSIMAIAEDTISRRIYDIRIFDLNKKEFLSEVIPGTSGNLVWANDNKTLFYVKKDPTTLLPYQVYKHTLGTTIDKDTLVYQEEDDTFYTHIYKTRSQDFIAISIESTMNSEVRLIDANDVEKPLITFLPREKDHLYSVDHIHNRFYVQTDLNALNEKIISVEQSLIGNKKHWKEIVAHDENTLIQNVELFANFMLVNERSNGLEKLRLRGYDGEIIKEINFEEGAYTAGIGNNPEANTNQVRYYYSSMTTPDSVYQYDFETEQSALLKQDKVIGEFNPKDYFSERIMIEARDGKKVPVSLIYRKDQFKSFSDNPLLHYAYGSYGSTIDPSFSSARLSLLDRGFVYAISHIRGSKMLGRQWYEDGKKRTKMNTFTDFNDATKALVKLGYGNKDKIYAMGGSAGGMLMGGIINMEPELYHGVVAAVPFVDVVTTMLDESIPLTTGEYDEWGNPNEKIYYDYMLSYSPYDQVKKQAYPNLLVTTGLHDSQVQYWEPAKWVAKLRDMKTDNNDLLLYVDMSAGHGGKSGRYQRYVDTAREYAFLLDLAGIKE